MQQQQEQKSSLALAHENFNSVEEISTPSLKPRIFSMQFPFVPDVKNSTIRMIREEKNPLFCVTDTFSVLLQTKDRRLLKSMIEGMPEDLKKSLLSRHVQGKKGSSELLANFDAMVALVDHISAMETCSWTLEDRKKAQAVLEQTRRVEPVFSFMGGVEVRVLYTWPEPMLSILDVICAVCGRRTDVDGKNYARGVFFRVKNEMPDVVCTPNDIGSCKNDFQFFGQGQTPTPISSLKTVLKLIQHLHGEPAAIFRQAVADLLVRFFSGDKSLHREIERNAESGNPLSRIAQESMQEGQGTADVEREPKRQKVEDAQSSNTTIFKIPEHWNADESYRVIVEVNKTMDKKIQLVETKGVNLKQETEKFKQESEKLKQETEKLKQVGENMKVELERDKMKVEMLLKETEKEKIGIDKENSTTERIKCEIEMEKLKMFSSSKENTDAYVKQFLTDCSTAEVKRIQTNFNKRTLASIIDHKLANNPRHLFASIPREHFARLDKVLSKLYLDQNGVLPPTDGNRYSTDPSITIHFYNDNQFLAQTLYNYLEDYAKHFDEKQTTLNTFVTIRRVG